VAFREPAALYVVNSCTVTREADDKCRKMVRRALRTNPGARLLVTGCAATTDPERYRSIPGVTAVLDRAMLPGIERWIESGEMPPEGDIFEMEISSFGGHTRAFLKIEDGCDAGCAYCIVPRARGAVRSRPLDVVRVEARRLAQAGHIEIVLTGIHLGYYGRGLDGVTLADAVRALLETPGIQRVRLSSLEGLELSDDLIALAATDSRFCPHFHLPLQSGDDAVLAAMGRRYTSGEFHAMLDRARAKLDRPSFTTDVMVGFPGETEEQFANTLAVCREAGFSRIHIFPFSVRPGTPAAAMPGCVPVEVVRERESRLKALADELAASYKRRFIGETVFPLVEHRRDRRSSLLTGWSERYIRVVFEGPDALKGTIAPVRIESVTAEQAAGNLSG
jgi:threonylcarbamoyladenosine tRNA methylthiotransferase MtaB